MVLWPLLKLDNPGGMTSPEHEPERNSREKQRTEQNSREQKRVTAQPTTDTPAAKKPRQTPTVSVATGIFPKN